jgi:AbrB family looped-hinge helix DNA binding protein
MQATITSKGQVTVPKAVRDRFHLSPGDKIQFVIDEDGTLRVIPVTATLRELKGMVPKPDRIVSLNEMEDAIVEGATKP